MLRSSGCLLHTPVRSFLWHPFPLTWSQACFRQSFRYKFLPWFRSGHIWFRLLLLLLQGLCLFRLPLPLHLHQSLYRLFRYTAGHWSIRLRWSWSVLDWSWSSRFRSHSLCRFPLRMHVPARSCSLLLPLHQSCSGLLSSSFRPRCTLPLRHFHSCRLLLLPRLSAWFRRRLSPRCLSSGLHTWWFRML